MSGTVWRRTSVRFSAFAGPRSGALAANANSARRRQPERDGCVDEHRVGCESRSDAVHTSESDRLGNVGLIGRPAAVRAEAYSPAGGLGSLIGMSRGRYPRIGPADATVRRTSRAISRRRRDDAIGRRRRLWCDRSPEPTRTEKGHSHAHIRPAPPDGGVPRPRLSVSRGHLRPAAPVERRTRRHRSRAAGRSRRSSCCPPLALAAAAFVTTSLADGRDGVRDLRKRVFQIQGPPGLVRRDLPPLPATAIATAVAVRRTSIRSSSW